MGHATGKDNYRRLGEKIDSLAVRTPWTGTFHAILTELYSTEEAALVAGMPAGLSDIERLSKITGYESVKLQKLLDGLCSKGLVFDLWVRDAYYYAPSPLVIGIFEMTMMRTGDDLDVKKISKLFHEYLDDKDAFSKANFGHGEKVSPIRALPHEDAVKKTEYLEVLDYEKASAIVEGHDKFSIGLCSCRHEKLHIGEKTCDTPLETCSSFGFAADYLIRHKLARKVSRVEMMENLRRSRELGLVLNADNVQNNVTFICHCCGCCCNALLGISRHGYANTIVTSSFIAEADEDLCSGCGKCAAACPIKAITMVPAGNPKSKKKKVQKTDTDICLGCGVCALHCKTKALSLVKRGQRVIHPETTFERIILQCLERGTLQYQMFDDPRSITQKFLRGFVGGVLKLPPVKKALMSDMFRSSFLNSLKGSIKKQGKGWALEL